MSSRKKHGCLWWLFIGWWWWLCPIKWLLVYLQRRPQTPPQPTPPQAPTQKAPAPSAPQPKVERHRVTGTSFHLDAIKALGVYNFDYDKNKREMIEDGLVGERIWQTDFFPRVTTLEPEPTNPEDPKAIKVVVDGVHIGYIKAGSCAHIHKVMREGRLESVKGEIKGGKYKIIVEDFDEDGNSTYSLERDDVPIYADVYIAIK